MCFLHISTAPSIPSCIPDLVLLGSLILPAWPSSAFEFETHRNRPIIHSIYKTLKSLQVFLLLNTMSSYAIFTVTLQKWLYMNIKHMQNKMPVLALGVSIKVIHF